MKKITGIVEIIAYIICYLLLILNVINNDFVEATFWLLLIWKTETRRSN